VLVNVPCIQPFNCRQGIADIEGTPGTQEHQQLDVLAAIEFQKLLLLERKDHGVKDELSLATLQILAVELGVRNLRLLFLELMPGEFPVILYESIHAVKLVINLGFLFHQDGIFSQLVEPIVDLAGDVDG
jgi:hypothetical protein